MTSRRYAGVLLPLLFAVAACQRINPTAALEPIEVVTGWYDEGVVAGQKNKLVPSVSLRLRNKSADAIRQVQINAIFRRVGEAEMWGEHYGWAVRRDPLAPGAATDALVMRSALGYTGEQPRMQMLQNKEFVDAKVEIFLKHGSQGWAKLTEFQVARQLLTQ